MGIESRSLDEYGKMSIESREKGKKKRNRNDKPTDHDKPDERFSVEMLSVHENLNAHEEFRRFHRLLCCSLIVLIVATFCTNGQETVLTPRAFRDIRHFARDRPSGSHGVAVRHRERSCRQSTSMTRDKGRMLDRGWAGRRLDGLKKKEVISGDALLRLQR